MASEATSNSSSFYKNYFAGALEYAKPNIILDQWALKESIEGEKFSTAVQWCRPNAPDASEIVTITEGSSTTSVSGSVVLTSISATPVEYGVSVGFTKKLNLTSAYDFMKQGKVHIGENVGLQIDSVIRNEIAVGTVGSATITDKYPNALGTKSFAGLLAETGAAASIKLNDIVYAVATLRRNKANPVNQAGFVMASDPAIAADIMLDNQFIELTKYGDPSRAYRGEVGRVGGLTLIMHNNSMRENTENTYAAAGSIYSNMVFGKNSYGISDYSNYRMQPTITPLLGADKTDIYGQNNIISATFNFVCAALNGDWIINLRSKTNFV